MKMLKHLICITGILFMIAPGLISGQEKQPPRQKIYLSKIGLSDSFRQTGVIVRVNDSSILFTPEKSRSMLEAGKFMVTDLRYNDIIRIKSRNINSRSNGFIIGSVIGLVSAMAALDEETTGLDFGSRLVLYGLPVSLLAGSAGLIIGSIGITIPVDESFEKYSLSRSKIQRYSWERDDSFGKISHNSYIGLTNGPSFPIGSFASDGFAKTGYLANILNLGYRIKGNFGIAVKGYNGQWNIEEGGTGNYWIFVGVMGGPQYSIPAGDKLMIDFVPVIGAVDGRQAYSDEEQLVWTGMCLGGGAAIRYNFAKRWSAIGETGIISFTIKDEDLVKKNYGTFNLGIGLAYRFH